MTNSEYNRVLAIITTVLIILLGIAFIVCCAHLYFTGGEKPYSAESVGKYLTALAVPSVITIVVMIGGLVMKIISGHTNDETTKRTNVELLESFSKRYDINAFEGATQEEIKAERNGRKTFAYVSIAFSAVVFALVLAYLLFAAEFAVDTLNADVISALTIALPLSVIAVGIHVPRVYLAEQSAKRELDLMKSYIKKNGAPKAAPKAQAKAEVVNYALVVKALIITVSAVFIFLGILNGGMDDVLQKAVKICTECIGLG